MAFYQRGEQTKPAAEPAQRKRRRKTPQVQEVTKAIQAHRSIKTPDFKLMIPIKKQMPPNTSDEIIVYGPELGFYFCPGFVALQHIEYDFNVLRKLSSITHWFSTLEL